MRSLDLDQLRALLEVVELGNFSAAARRLNLTQPAISLQIRELERRFGVQLIERSRQAGACHRAGPRVWSRHAQRIFHECDARRCGPCCRFREGWLGQRADMRHDADRRMLYRAAADPARACGSGSSRASTSSSTTRRRATTRRAHSSRTALDLALVTSAGRGQAELTHHAAARRESMVAPFPAGGARNVPGRWSRPTYAARQQPLVLEHAL